jgi:hypothetical protein
VNEKKRIGVSKPGRIVYLFKLEVPFQLGVPKRGSENEMIPVLWIKKWFVGISPLSPAGIVP